MSSKKLDWAKIIMAVVIAALGFFGVATYLKANKEEQRRIEAQNEIARASEVLQEREQLWSRLSQQKNDVISDLRQLNSEMADVIEGRDEQILSLTQAVARIKAVKIVVRRENIEQVVEQDRTRVSFNEEVDPVRVSGFTLTNPPEAELEVGFVRPLRLTTTVTQQESGAWRTYISGDWPNLEIEQIETIVNPRPIRGRNFVENIIIGMNVQTSTVFDSAFGNLFIMYDFEHFAVGPAFGIGVIDDSARFLLGINFELHPWR